MDLHLCHLVTIEFMFDGTSNVDGEMQAYGVLISLAIVLRFTIGVVDGRSTSELDVVQTCRCSFTRQSIRFTQIWL